jgi:hypothetical protein
MRPLKGIMLVQTCSTQGGRPDGEFPRHRCLSVRYRACFTTPTASRCWPDVSRWSKT